MPEVSDVIKTMRTCAVDLLDAMSAGQRSKLHLNFDDEVERRSWYYTPSERGGLPLIEMSPRQQLLAMRLLLSGLSEGGYGAVCTIFGLENVLGRLEGRWAGRMSYQGREAESRVRDPSLYFFSIFGDPQSDGLWSWRVGGHHINLHYTIHGDEISATPMFLGADPAVSPLPGGALLRPLAAEEDVARNLLELLSADQLGKAVISTAAPGDLVQGNRPYMEDQALPRNSNDIWSPQAMVNPEPRYALQREANRGRNQVVGSLGLTPELEEALRFTRTPKGLTRSEMDSQQRALLDALVDVYVGCVAEPISEAYKSRLDSHEMAFAWCGSVSADEPHYYRIQSELMLIEYDCTARNGNHIHSAWRDVAIDFGGE